MESTSKIILQLCCPLDRYEIVVLRLGHVSWRKYSICGFASIHIYVKVFEVTRLGVYWL